jgi:hypothetical protein
MVCGWAGGEGRGGRVPARPRKSWSRPRPRRVLRQWLRGERQRRWRPRRPIAAVRTLASAPAPHSPIAPGPLQYPQHAYAVAQLETLSPAATAGMRYTPTFNIYRSGRKVDEVVGKEPQRLEDHLWLHAD